MSLLFIWEGNMTSIILAGGRSLHLGRDKALTAVGGTNLIELVAARLKPISDRVLVVSSQELFPLLSMSYQGEIIIDKYIRRGPLGGIYTGLIAAASPYVLVVACDMPFLNRELLHYITILASSYDAVVPCLSGVKAEPLHTVYSRGCLDIMKETLESKNWSMNALLRKLNVRYVTEEECRRFDAELLSFFNINNQQDLERAEAIAVRAEPN